MIADLRGVSLLPKDALSGSAVLDIVAAPARDGFTVRLRAGTLPA
jgi:hypothetical protein